MTASATSKKTRNPLPEGVWLLLVLAGASIFVTIYTVLTFYRIHSMRLGTDTGVYLQTLRNFVHTGSTYNFGENTQKLYVHDSWAAIITFAPIVAAFPRAETLLIAGVVTIAAAAVPLYFFGKSCGLSGPSAAAIAAVYLICPTTQGLAFGNFTEAHLIPLFAFSLALAARRKSLIAAFILAELLTGIKEDESLFLIWFGIASLVWYDRRLGLGLIAIGALNFEGYEVFQRLSGHQPHNPSYGFHDYNFLQHLAFLAEILAPFAFLPLLLGWRLLLVIPFVAEITLNKPWLVELARGGSHYTIPLLTVLALGTVFVVRERPNAARFLVPASLVMMIFFNTTVFRFGRHEYPPQWSRYCEAERAATDGRYHAYAIDKEDIFAIAAANPNVHLTKKRATPVNAPPWWSGTNAPSPAPSFTSCATFR